MHADAFVLIFWIGVCSIAFFVLAVVYELIEKEIERRDRRRAREWRRYMQRGLR